MRKFIIAGNWKMYKNIPEAIDFANGLKRETFNFNLENIDVVICAPFTALSELSEVLVDSGIKLGAQDVYWQDEGAFTGEISVPMLIDAGCSFVIIGHSERRQYFSETNASVNNKVKAALKGGLTAIMCVGETLKERETNRTFAVLEDQLEGGLKDISAEDVLKIVLAYEPVWAIGTGKTATPQQAQEAQKYIRGLLIKLYNNNIACDLRIQYGGSVKSENTQELMQQPDIDGALVGGASLKVAAFVDIIKNALGVKK